MQFPSDGAPETRLVATSTAHAYKNKPSLWNKLKRNPYHSASQSLLFVSLEHPVFPATRNVMSSGRG